MTIGLVLGGGGPVGIGWELGVLHGLADAGVDLGQVSVVVGTSAGSVVGSQVAAGADLAALVADQHEDADLPGLGDGDGESAAPDMTRVIEIFGILGGEGPMTTELAAEVGRMALDAPTPPESRWVARFEDLLDGTDWSDLPLLVTAVDCESGERRVWTSASGVPLHLAVASSCAVPGMFPPVTIEGRRYTDGGVWSISNADLLLDREVDIALLVLPAGTGPMGTMPAVTREQRLLSEAGVAVHTVSPGPEFADRIGINLMDARLRGVAADIGVADGRAAASGLSA